MNNLVYNPNQGAWPNLQNYYTTSRSGEPIYVSGRESANSFQTVPNTVTILFDKNDNIFYHVETDGNNYPTIRQYRYEEEKPAPKEEIKYVTMQEFNAFKEEFLNGQQHLRNGATESASGVNNSTGTTNNECDATRAESIANVSRPDKSKSSI